jgi:hypothetical protein
MKLDLPELKDGEIYAGAIINPDGTGNHIVLLDGELTDSKWDDAMAWAKNKGGTRDTKKGSELYASIYNAINHAKF